MKQKKISFEEAEKFKIEHGLKDDDDKTDGSSLLALDITEKTAVEMIVQEVKRSIRFYVKEAGNSDFRKLMLVGGSAKLKGLPEYIADQVKLDTEVYNPFVNLEKPEKFQQKQDPQLALALGLAMRPE